MDEPTTTGPSDTSVSAVPTTAATSTSTDPHIGRPVHDEVLILSMLDSETGEICRESFGSDTAACYDAYKLATEDFEEVIVRNLESRTGCTASAVWRFLGVVSPTDWVFNTGVEGVCSGLQQAGGWEAQL